MDGVGGDTHGRVRGEGFGGCSQVRQIPVGVAGVNRRARLIDQGARGLGANRHIGQHELQPLQIGDRPAEGLATLHVVAREINRRLGDADRLGADGRARAIQRVHRHEETFALVADAV